jgi:hypothetical protein
MSTTADHNVETPDEHGFVLTGPSLRHGHHLPMFHFAQHRYQAVLRFGFSDAVRDTIKADAATHPTAVYALVNTGEMLLKSIAEQKKPFNAYISRITPQAKGHATFETIGWSFRVSVLETLKLRKFNDADEFPEWLTYILYGQGDEVALAHRPTKADDFDQVLELKGLPDGLSDKQLAKGTVRVRFPKLAERPSGGGHYTKNPLPEPPYKAEAEVNKTWQPITIHIKSAPWFDTDFLNMANPDEHTSGTVDDNAAAGMVAARV